MGHRVQILVNMELQAGPPFISKSLYRENFESRRVRGLKLKFHHAHGPFCSVLAALSISILSFHGHSLVSQHQPLRILPLFVSSTEMSKLPFSADGGAMVTDSLGVKPAALRDAETHSQPCDAFGRQKKDMRFDETKMSLGKLQIGTSSH